MTTLIATTDAYEPICRAALQTGLTLIARIVPPILLSLFALLMARRHSVETRRLVANAGVASVAAVAALSLLCAFLPSSLPSLWAIALPTSQGISQQIGPVSRIYTGRALPGGSVPHASSSDPAQFVEALTSVGLPVWEPVWRTPPFLQASDGFARPLVQTGSAITTGRGAGSLRRPGSIDAGIGPHVAVGRVSAVRSSRSEFADLESVVTALALAWMIGSVVLLLWLVGSAASVDRMVRRGRKVEDESTLALLVELCARKGVGPPRLVACSQARSPFVTGIRQPTLVLPASYDTDFEAQALRAILAHEVMHLVQRDCAWTLISRLCCALCWPLLPLWTLCRLREALSEEACDLAVLKEGCPPTVYARCLLALAERLRPLRPEGVVGVGTLTSRSGLGRRIERILAGARGISTPLSPSTRLFVLIGAVALTLPCMILVGQAAPKGGRPHGQEVEATSPASRSNRSEMSDQSAQADSDAVQGREPSSGSVGEAERAKQARRQTEAEEEAARAAQLAARNVLQAQQNAVAAELRTLEARHKQVEAEIRSKSAAERKAREERTRRAAQQQLRILQSRLRQVQAEMADAIVRGQDAQVAMEAELQQKVAAQHANLAAARATVDTQQAQLQAARAALEQAASNAQRDRQNYTNASPQMQQAEAELQRAQANVRTQEVQLKAQLQAAEVALEQSQRDHMQRSASQSQATAEQRRSEIQRLSQIMAEDQRAQMRAAEAALAQAERAAQEARRNYTDTSPQMQRAEEALRQAQANVASQEVKAIQAQIDAQTEQAVAAARQASRSSAIASRIGSLNVTFGTPDTGVSDSGNPAGIDKVHYVIDTGSADDGPIRVELSLKADQFDAGGNKIGDRTLLIGGSTSVRPAVGQSEYIYSVPAGLYLAQHGHTANLGRIDYHYELTLHHKSGKTETKRSESRKLTGNALNGSAGALENWPHLLYRAGEVG